MQATFEQAQAGTIVRRPMDIEDYLDLVRRHISWILGPVLLGLTTAVVVACFWPNTYISQAAIRVVPPQVPEKFVPTNVNVEMAQRVTNMTQTILSRNTLTNIIQTYDLYRKERNDYPLEDIIEKMRSAINIGGLQTMAGRRGAQTEITAFKITFAYENRYTAQKVTRDLMTRFIDENIRERTQQSNLTTQFLREQYDQGRSELDAIEKKLTEFRIRNAGRLPDQLNTNMQAVSAIETRISSLNAGLGRANQEKMMLESELRATRDRLNSVAKAQSEAIASGGQPVANGGVRNDVDDQIARADADIRRLERALEAMLEQYKPTYPDVQRLQARLQSAKKERDDLVNRRLAVQEPASASPATTSAPRPPSAAKTKDMMDLEGQVVRLQGQIKAKEAEAERYIREIQDSEKRFRDLNSRIEAGPANLAEYEQLNRDYELAKKRYDDSKVKVSQSETATDLENRKQGETLEVLDLPSLPETPTDPDRPVIIGGGVVLGLGVGLVLAVVREFRDTSLKSLKDVRAYTRYNVLGSVPLLENDLVARRRRRLSLIAWATAILLSAIVMAGSTYYYLLTYPRA